jgi:LacI family transcriptional regulator
MATLRDVANRAGVDVSTASKVLGGGKIRVSDSTRLRIESAARALDYTPNAYAQGLRLRRKGALAMAVQNTTNYVFPEIVEGAEEAAERLGTSLFLVKQPVGSHADRLLSIIRQGRMDGWIFADEAPCDGFFADLLALRVPFVTLNRFGEGPGPYICLDDEAGFRAQAEQIVALGHRRVAFIGVQPESYISRLCRHSFVKRMASFYLPLPPTHVLGGDFEGNDAERLADAVLNLKPRPTAVACGSMQAASRLIEALVVRRVQIPDEIGVVGYHDPPTAIASRPPLTTVRMPSREQGRIAVERLVELIDGTRSGYQGEIVPAAPEFVLRGSLAPIG